jgi:hypothetical protein
MPLATLPVLTFSRTHTRKFIGDKIAYDSNNKVLLK